MAEIILVIRGKDLDVEPEPVLLATDKLHQTVSIKITGEDITCSDGHHSFQELYEHRCILFLAYCRLLSYFQFTADGWLINEGDWYIWRSKKHAPNLDEMDGWFLLGIVYKKGTPEEEQISYHLPIKHWELAQKISVELDSAYPFDGHTSEQVLERLAKIFERV